jgi:hypothetical protein
MNLFCKSFDSKYEFSEELAKFLETNGDNLYVILRGGPVNVRELFGMVPEDVKPSLAHALFLEMKGVRHQVDELLVGLHYKILMCMSSYPHLSIIEMAKFLGVSRSVLQRKLAGIKKLCGFKKFFGIYGAFFFQGDKGMILKDTHLLNLEDLQMINNRLLGNSAQETADDTKKKRGSVVNRRGIINKLLNTRNFKETTVILGRDAVNQSHPVDIFLDLLGVIRRDIDKRIEEKKARDAWVKSEWGTTLVECRPIPPRKLVIPKRLWKKPAKAVVEDKAILPSKDGQLNPEGSVSDYFSGTQDQELKIEDMDENAVAEDKAVPPSEGGPLNPEGSVSDYFSGTQDMELKIEDMDENVVVEDKAIPSFEGEPLNPEETVSDSFSETQALELKIEDMDEKICDECVSLSLVFKVFVRDLFMKGHLTKRQERVLSVLYPLEDDEDTLPEGPYYPCVSTGCCHRGKNLRIFLAERTKKKEEFSTSPVTRLHPFVLEDIQAEWKRMSPVERYWWLWIIRAALRLKK